MGRMRGPCRVRRGVPAPDRLFAFPIPQGLSIRGGPMPEVNLSNITLSDDLQRLLISKVESGQFASPEALVEEALRSFLIERPAPEAPERDRAAEPQPERLPSPFILDEWAFGPGDIPRRPGREVDCVFLRGEKRRPDRYPGE
jgi:hypothetical protein